MHHVFTTTSISTADANAKEDTDVAAFYGESKIRMEGQKRNPFRMQTIIIFKHTGKAREMKFYMNTFIKDRAREWMIDKEWNDFYFQYLIDVAGWE